MSVPYHEYENYSDPIPECVVGKDWETLTIMAVAPHELSYFKSLSDEQLVVGVAEVPEVEGIGDDQAQAPIEEVPIAAPQLDGVVAPDELVINELVLKPTSACRDLRAAAKFLGVSQSGSKARILERTCACHILALTRRSLELAEQAYVQEEVPSKETIYASTPQPSERERRLHEITHLPFRQWCPFCVAGKSRADCKRSVEVSDIPQREHPAIQLDIMFAPGGSSVLVLVDTWTGYAFAVSMRTKSAKSVANSISEFFLGCLVIFVKWKLSPIMSLFFFQVSSKHRCSGLGLDLKP